MAAENINQQLQNAEKNVRTWSGHRNHRTCTEAEEENVQQHHQEVN